MCSFMRFWQLNCSNLNITVFIDIQVHTVCDPLIRNENLMGFLMMPNIYLVHFIPVLGCDELIINSNSRSVVAEQ